MGRAEGGLRWSEFSDETSELARDIAAVVERYRFALVATIRKDGTPRISAVETHLVGDDLVLVMIPNTRKAADVRRDNRLTLQSPITSAGDPGPEYKLRGLALPMESEEARESAASAVEAYSGWRPRPAWLFLSVVLSDASHTKWSPDGTALMRRWSLADGVVETRTQRLDMETGSYRSD
ncbi:MAG: pyridoxamine 5'-phosphate oxidase family protein [Actinomycetota bacterium]|nr:pyridoxamine 5'-phosphate oxidase family protein [Actinomycetota bacterium]